MVKYNVEIHLLSGDTVEGLGLSSQEAQLFVVEELARYYSLIPFKMTRNIFCNLITRPSKACKVLQNLVKVTRVI